MSKWTSWRLPFFSKGPTASRSGGTGAATQADDDARKEGWNVGDVLEETYRIDQIFDAGGMGMVYRVHHLGWDIELAMKVPRAELAHESVFMDNFNRECQSWIDLGFHRNVVGCYYLRFVEGAPAVFVEYVDGGSLADWISSGRLYTGSDAEVIERVLRIAIQSANGLQHAHTVGLIHQDIKPANILMTGDGQPRLADFGLARARGLTAASTNLGADATTLVTMGGYTPMYCSPEQALGQRLSRATDIWSWAAGIVEMLCGGVVWPSGPEVFRALSILSSDEDSARPVRVIPDGLIDVLAACLDTNPDDRVSDAADIIERLSGVYSSTFNRPAPFEAGGEPHLLASTCNNRAVSLADLNETDRAIAEFERALSMDPAHPEATYNYALLQWYRQQLSEEDVVARIQRTRLAGSGEGRSHMMEARFALRLSRIDRAIDSWQRALNSLDTRAEAALRLAEAAMGAESYEDATRYFNIAAQSLPYSERVRRGSEMAEKQVRVANGSIVYGRMHGLATLSGVGIAAALDSNARSCVYVDANNRLVRWNEASNTLAVIAEDQKWRAMSPAGSHVLSTAGVILITNTQTGTRRTALLSPSLRGTEVPDASSFSLSEDGCRVVTVTTIQDKGGFAGGTIGHFPDSEIWVAEVTLLDSANDQLLARFPLTLNRYRSGNVQDDSLTTCAAISADGLQLCFSTGATLYHHSVADETTIVFDCCTEIISTLVGADRGGDIYIVSDDAVLRLDAATGRVFPVLNAGVPIDAIRVRDNRIALATRDGRVSVWTSDGKSQLAAMNAAGIFRDITDAARVSSVDCIADRILLTVGSTSRVMDLPAIAAERTIGAQMAIAPITVMDAVDSEAKKFQDLLDEAHDEVKNHNLAAAATRVRRARRLDGFERHPDAVEFTARHLSELPKGELGLVWSEPLLSVKSRGPGAIAVDSSDVLYVVGDTTIIELNLADATIKQHAGDFADVTCATACSAGLVVGTAGGGVGIWQPGQDAFNTLHTEHEWQVRSAAVTSDGDRVAMGSADGTVTITSTTNPAHPKVLKDEGDYGVNAVAFDSNGGCLLAGGDDRIIRVWDIETGTVLRRIEDLPATVRLLRGMQDGRFLASYDNGAVEILRLSDTVERNPLFSADGVVTAMARSGQSGMTILGTDSGKFEIRQIENGHCLFEFAEHASAIVDLVTARNGHRAYTLDVDGQVRRWILDWSL